MKKLISKIQKTLNIYSLIQDGDKIAVGVSGGKDSLACLIALAKLKEYYFHKFELVAITVDNFSGDADYSSITTLCEELGIVHHVERTDIADVVFNIRKEKNPCSLCAKMRRGTLCEVGTKLGCNKIALGHHKDDVINTFLMSMLYESRLKSIKPSTNMSRSDITIIRPLFLCCEKEIISATRHLNIVKNKCPIDRTTKRSEMYDVIKALTNIVPQAYDRIGGAVLSSDRYDLLP